MHSKKKYKRHISPPVVIAGNFLLLIIIGTLLLKLPIATEHPISWIDALFTVTSATTVTGLIVFDPGLYTYLIRRNCFIVAYSNRRNWLNGICRSDTFIAWTKSWDAEQNLSTRILQFSNSRWNGEIRSSDFTFCSDC